jgi:hypothetical protein
MRHPNRLQEVLVCLPASGATQFPGMTYEQGIEDALMWAMEELEDDDFEYAP